MTVCIPKLELGNEEKHTVAVSSVCEDQLLEGCPAGTWCFL